MAEISDIEKLFTKIKYVAWYEVWKIEPKNWYQDSIAHLPYKITKYHHN